MKSGGSNNHSSGNVTASPGNAIPRTNAADDDDVLHDFRFCRCGDKAFMISW